MKKLLTGYIFLMVFFVQSYAQQAGDLAFGLDGGYAPANEDFMYGVDISYSVIDPLELSFTYFMNPGIEATESNGRINKTSLYSFNFDVHYYLLLKKTWAMGPTLGGQYFKKKVSYDDSSGSGNSRGLNVGWHMRYNFTENIMMDGGWRYTAANNDNSYHFVYLGIGYSFNLF